MTNFFVYSSRRFCLKLGSDMGAKWINIGIDDSFWDRFYLPFPLVVIGSKENNHFDLAPKHMAIPMSWENHYGFVCSPEHSTYQNIKEHGFFTVSYPKPSQVVSTSLTASPREGTNSDKAILDFIQTVPAEQIDGVFLKDSFLMLECKLFKIYDDFGRNSLITVIIINARAHVDYLRNNDKDEQHQLHKHPLLTYLHPGRFAAIRETSAFPFPLNFKK